MGHTQRREVDWELEDAMEGLVELALARRAARKLADIAWGGHPVKAEVVALSPDQSVSQRIRRAGDSSQGSTSEAKTPMDWFAGA